MLPAGNTGSYVNIQPIGGAAGFALILSMDADGVRSEFAAFSR